MRLLVACIAVAALGCGTKEAAVTPAACDAAVAHLALPAKVKSALAAECLDAKWSAAVVACVTAATDPGACKDKMTPEQRGAITRLAAEAARADADLAAQAKAEAAATQALEEAKQAQETVERLEQEASDLQKRMTAAMDTLVGASSNADRDTAKANLDQLVKDKAALDAGIADAKAKAARAERVKGIGLSKECLENPLAKGCS